MEPIWNMVVDVMMATLVAGILVPLVPLAIVLAFFMAVGRRAWLRMLCKRYPTLRFEPRTRLTAAMDSARSQGTATALLMVRGVLDAHDLRAILQTRLLNASATHPHLRLALDWRLGRYAWRDPDGAFDVARHVLEAQATWRGRPVDAFNVQECVSAQAARRLPPGHSPWQVALFVAGEQTYVLVRAHLALLAADKLSLEDILPLEHASLASAADLNAPQRTPQLLGEDDELPPPTPKQVSSAFGFSEENEDGSTEEWENKVFDPPLVPPPPDPLTALHTLWISFVSYFFNIIQAIKTLDPALGGSHPRDPFRWTVALLVAATHIVIRAPGDPHGLRMKYLLTAPGDLLDALLHVLNPWVAVRVAMATAWRVGVWMSAVAPLLVAREAALLAAGRGRETASGAAVSVTLLLGAAVAEVGSVLFGAIRAPRSVLQELQAAWSEPLSELQAVSLCGRRVVAWSSPVPVSTVRRARASATASDEGRRPSVDEVALAALARALDAYFLLAALPQPAAVPATARAQTLAQALGPAAQRAQAWTCIALPTGVASEGWRKACEATARAARVAQERATGLRAASEAARCVALALLPSVTLRMALNALTRRYAVSITFLREEEHHEDKKQWKGSGKLQLAGRNVEEIMVWRPPQANISLSLTLVRGIRGLQLGALADAQLTPAPAFLAGVFERELRSAAGEAPPPVTAIS